MVNYFFNYTEQNDSIPNQVNIYFIDIHNISRYSIR